MEGVRLDHENFLNSKLFWNLEIFQTFLIKFFFLAKTIVVSYEVYETANGQSVTFSLTYHVDE